MCSGIRAPRGRPCPAVSGALGSRLREAGLGPGAEKRVRARSPGASMRNPAPLRRAFGGATIGSKQMHCAFRGANTCAQG